MNRLLFTEPVASPLNPALHPSEREPHPIRVLIVDDQNFVRKMLQYSLESQLDLEIIGTADGGKDALAKIERFRPDIALVDIEMPEMNGLDMTRTISAQYPQTKVLVISIHDDKNYIRDALQAGAKGYLLKNTPPAELAHAIRFVKRGYLQLGPGLFEKLEEYPVPIKNPPPSEELAPRPTPTPSLAIPEPVSLESQPLELDWSAATHEAIDILPNLWTRGVLYLMLAFTAVILPWAAFSQVDEVGIAQGRLEPKGNTIRLDAPVSGTVAVMHVREGQSVQKGQPLMELQSEIVNGDLQQAQLKREGLLNRQTQLIAIKAQLESSLSTARQQVRTQAASQQASVDKIQQQQTSQQDSLGLIRELLKKDRTKVTLLDKLASQGAIPRSQAEDAERVAIQNNQLLQKTQADIQQSKGELQKQQIEYQRILREGELNLIDKVRQVKLLDSQITDGQSQMAQAQNQIKSLQYQRQQRVLYAPASGTLFQLPIQHPGAVVSPGQLVAQIAPQVARLVLRARMDNKKTGFIKVGLPTRLKFDAYPFQDYGILKGRISWISPTSTQAPPSSTVSPLMNSANSASNFEIEVALEQPFVQVQGKAIALKAGQTATAEVIIRQKRVLDLFLDPFRKLGKNGLQL
jgi:hemolysin D